MATDGLKSLGGESDLIDGALTSSRSKEDGYHPDERGLWCPVRYVHQESEAASSPRWSLLVELHMAR